MRGDFIEPVVAMNRRAWRACIVVLWLMGDADPRIRAQVEPPATFAELAELEAAWHDYGEAPDGSRDAAFLALVDATESALSEVAATPDKKQAILLIERTVALLFEPLAARPEWANRVAAAAVSARPLALACGGDYPRALEYELALFLLVLRDLDAAGKVLDAALSKWLDDPGLLLLQTTLYRLREDWPAALATIERAETAAAVRPAGPEADLDRGQVALEFAAIDMLLGRADRALLRLEGLVDAANNGVPPPIRGAALDLLADVLVLCDRPQDVVQLAESRGDQLLRDQRPDFDVKVAIARGELGRDDPAANRRARAGLEEAIARPGVSEVAIAIATMEAADLALALADSAEARRLLSAARGRLATWDAIDLERERRLETAWLAALSARLAIVEGTAVNERARVEEELRVGYARLLETWASVPLLPGGIGFLRLPVRRRVVHQVLDLALRNGSPEAALELLLRAQEQGSLARRWKAVVRDVAAVRRALLSGGEGLLVYLPTADGSHLFVLHGDDDVEHHPLAPEKTLLAAAGRLARACEQPGENGVSLSAAAEELSNLLLPKDLRSRIAGWSLLRIVGEAGIDDVPFELLTGSDGLPLGLSRAIAYLPSLPVGVYLRERQAATSREPSPFDLCLLVGPDAAATSAAKDDRRPLIDPATLIAPFVRERVALLGPAEEVSVKLQALRSARAATIVGHGVIDRTRARFAGVLLDRAVDGSDRVIWADELERNGVPELLCMVACGSSEGPIRVGEDGAAHLSGAALAGGASSVIVGHGELDATAAMRVVARLHAEIANGVAPAEGLRRARVAFAATAASNPRDWIGLRLVGLGDQAIPMARIAGRRSRWPVGLAFAMGALLFFCSLRVLLHGRIGTR